VHEEREKPLVFLVMEIAEVDERRIDCQREECVQNVFVYQRAPYQIPIGIENEQQPPAKKKAYQTSHAMIERHTKQSVWNEEEEPKQVVSPQPNAQHKHIEKKLHGYRQQFVGFNFLGRSFLHTETQQEIYSKEKDGASINHIVGLNARLCENEIEGHSEKHEINRPKTHKHISKNLHNHIALKHRMTFVCQSLVIGYQLI
jgi:hypothetical protein